MALKSLISRGIMLAFNSWLPTFRTLPLKTFLTNNQSPTGVITTIGILSGSNILFACIQKTHDSKECVEPRLIKAWESWLRIENIHIMTLGNACASCCAKGNTLP